MNISSRVSAIPDRLVTYYYHEKQHRLFPTKPSPNKQIPQEQGIHIKEQGIELLPRCLRNDLHCVHTSSAKVVFDKAQGLRSTNTPETRALLRPVVAGMGQYRHIGQLLRGGDKRSKRDDTFRSFHFGVRPHIPAHKKTQKGENTVSKP